VLVLSGETKREDLPGSPFQPDFVCENLAELAEILKEARE
jgi:ribonucleotide monophosphatase NagD (HAD superfamily)